ncbi:MAG: hypothetical protein KHZ58_05100 [Hungatella hathewayi]|nr:hypothetical protein [Hungatella hathewayi]
MKELYVLLLYLPSTFGRLSQIATRYPYTHVAISLDDSYTYFYAFSRLRAKTPPISGYIEEKRVYYTLGEDVPIQTKIFRVPVTEEGYERAVAYMDEVKRDREIMYNLLNMLLIPVFGGHPVYKAFHCGEFIAKVLEQAGVELKKPYYRYTPRLFAELLGEYEIFEGVLENDLSEGMEDDFFRETPRGEYLGKTCYIIRELLYRQIFHRASPGFRPEAVRFVVEDGKL